MKKKNILETFHIFLCLIMTSFVCAKCKYTRVSLSVHGVLSTYNEDAMLLVKGGLIIGTRRDKFCTKSESPRGSHYWYRTDNQTLVQGCTSCGPRKLLIWPTTPKILSILLISFLKKHP
jgi:hypothetical protein